MKKKCILFLCLLISFFLFETKVNAKSTFQCEYTISKDEINISRDGKLTCEMGYDSLFWIKTTILDCSWKVENKVDVWVIEHGTENFDVSSYLKNGGTNCPKYVAMQTSSQSYEDGGFFTDGVNAYFSNELSDVQDKVADGGIYYTIGDLDGLNDSQLDDLVCKAKDEKYYNNLFTIFQKQIDEFYDNDCDEFSLTEEEKETVALPESFKKYGKCQDYLGYAPSFFNNEIDSLKRQYSNNKCYDKKTYEDLLYKMTDYQDQFNNLKETLEEAFNAQPESPGDPGNSEEENPPAPPIENPDYDVNNDANLSNICSNPSYRKPMKFIGVFVNFIRIIVPILIIGFGVFDLYKAVTASKEDGLKKAIKSIAIRGIAGVFIFLLPGIIQFVLNMVNEWSDYKNAWCCCTDCLLNPDCNVNSCSSNSCHIEGTNK